MNRLVHTVICCFLVLLFHSVCGFAIAADSMESGRLTDETRQMAVEVLRDGMATEQRWVKVHAAEFLLGLSFPQGVRESFEQELVEHGDTPEYRLGVWRVLAMAARTPVERGEYIARITAVARSEDPDRLHAVESLAKLGVAVDAATASEVAQWVAGVTEEEAAFGRWLLALAGHSSVAATDQDQADQEQAIAKALASDSAIARLRAAYALAQMEHLSESSVKALLDAGELAANHTSSDQILQLADMYVMSAAWQVGLARSRLSRDGLNPAGSERDGETGYAARIDRLRQGLEQRSADSGAAVKVMADGLARVGLPVDAALLVGWLQHADADARLSAAHALLRLDRRRPGAMTGLDWSIIAFYLAAMIGVGLFYARRTQSTDDFLLGGRHMSPWMVGLSLFATLLSTLTYLAVPGEMIRHGPVVVMGLASLPLVAWLVGWYIIPFFMRLQVTSAYEILEKRFGYGGRLLGTLMFLSLRFFWMAVILYATTNAVLVPLLGWSAASTPWICAALGLITVIYSSLGGLRAVVLTDVMQTAILLGGALIALSVITFRLGGVGAWWPTQWDPAWTPFRVFDPTSPRTLLMALIGTGIWYVCTAGSDQMAIQRYLATRDVKAARRMFNITLAMNFVSWGLLTVLGFALLGFYRAHPEFLADNATLAKDADKLFPRFIAVGLPAGLSGLVVAGLLAAAMSSLSSGINSSCAVISVDYVSRWRKTENRKPQLRETQLISWAIGAVAVSLSMLAAFVPGNLLDVVYRIGNLLVAPLFVLFFMALFVKRATWPATLVAVLSSIAVAVVVAYGQVFASGLASWLPGASGLSATLERIAALGVLWIMPLSLLTGVVLGWLGSIMKLGQPAPPLPASAER